MNDNSSQLELLTKQAACLVAIQKCKNLVSGLADCFSLEQPSACTELFADRADSLIEAPWGIYDAYSGVQKFAQDMAAMTDRVNIRCTNNELLVVADDGLTARGAWASPGICTVTKSDGTKEARWLWQKLAVDFIFDGENWKIWHLRIYPMYDTKFDLAWSTSPRSDFSGMAKICHADRPASCEPWSIGDPYPQDQPDPPKRYAAYDDVGLTISVYPEAVK